MTTTIAFLGTGLMGYPMAKNLAAAGYRVLAWNRTAEKSAGLAEHGCTVVEQAEFAAREADIVISMLSDGPAVLAMAEICMYHLGAGTIWIDMSSTRATEARQIADILGDFQVSFLDAPVSGGTKGAADASLAIMVGGEQDDFEAVTPILSALGTATRVGATGCGQMCKLANQAIVGITIGAVAEAQLFLEAGGVDTDAMRQALSGGFADSTVLQLHGQRMASRDFTPGGTTTVQLKDMRNVLAEAGNLSLPLIEAVEARYAHLVESMGITDDDHSALFKELLARNGH